MALEADGFRRPGGLDLEPRAVAARLGAPGREAVGRLRLAAGLRVQAARPVAGLAPGVERIGPLRNQPRVVSRGEIPADRLVALGTFLGANVPFAPGTSGRTTTARLTVLHERTTSSKTTAPAAAASDRLPFYALPASSGNCISSYKL